MNHITIIGRLTKDVEIQNGSKQDGSVWTKGKGTIAEDIWTGKETKGQFINFQLWGNKAENLAKFCRKGSPVALIGRLRIDNYTDQQGQKKSFTYVEVENFQTFADKRDIPDAKEEASQFSSLNNPKSAEVPDNFDDDIPF